MAILHRFYCIVITRCPSSIICVLLQMITEPILTKRHKNVLWITSTKVAKTNLFPQKTWSLKSVVGIKSLDYLQKKLKQICSIKRHGHQGEWLIIIRITLKFFSLKSVVRIKSLDYLQRVKNKFGPSKNMAYVPLYLPVASFPYITIHV